MSRSASEPREAKEPPRVIGRYELYERIAAGGMAAVYFGRLVGPVGFSRTVAVKRLHPQFAQDPEFVAMFLDEARLAGRIRHPNVVPVLDVVAMHDELFLVMDYVQGESLGRLVRAAKAQGLRAPLPIVTTIFLNVLEGLHAAHEVSDDAGRPLGIVHRDVSPQNVLVGLDGVSRVLDFGVAKATGRVHHTKSGVTKGKLAYMAPEQIVGVSETTRTADVYATSVCLWEALTGSRLYNADSEAALMHRVLQGKPPSPRDLVPEVPEVVAQIVLRGLAHDPEARFPTAHDMARALAAAGLAAPAMAVAEWVRSLAGEALSKRAAVIAGIESDSARGSAEAVAFVEHLKLDPLVTVDLEGASGEGLGLEGTSPSRSTSGVVATRARRELGAAGAPARKGPGVVVALAAALVLALGAVGWLLLARPQSTRAAAGPLPVVAAPAPSPTTEPAVTSASAPAPPAASASSSAAPIASSSSPAMSSSARPQKPAAGRPPKANPGPKADTPSDGFFERN